MGIVTANPALHQVRHTCSGCSSHPLWGCLPLAGGCYGHLGHKCLHVWKKKGTWTFTVGWNGEEFHCECRGNINKRTEEMNGFTASQWHAGLDTLFRNSWSSHCTNCISRSEQRSGQVNVLLQQGCRDRAALPASSDGWGFLSPSFHPFPIMTIN